MGQTLAALQPIQNFTFELGLCQTLVMKKIRLLFLLVFLTASFAWSQDSPQLNLQRLKLSAGLHLIDVQVALNSEQRTIGLMHRREMPQNEGMLFVFELPTIQCFWMKNTLIPLTAAFLEDNGTIVNLEDMRPQTTNTHCSKQPVRYVLEMNQGWFAKKGIKAGARLSGSPFPP